MLKWILKKYDLEMGTGFNWEYVPVVLSCGDGNEPIDSKKKWWISLLTEWLVTF